jgi:hypothetical protein
MHRSQKTTPNQQKVGMNFRKGWDQSEPQAPLSRSKKFAWLSRSPGACSAVGTGYVSRPEVSIVFNQICTWTSMIFVTFRFGSS